MPWLRSRTISTPRTPSMTTTKDIGEVSREVSTMSFGARDTATVSCSRSWIPRLSLKRLSGMLMSQIRILTMQSWRRPTWVTSLTAASAIICSIMSVKSTSSTASNDTTQIFFAIRKVMNANRTWIITLNTGPSCLRRRFSRLSAKQRCRFTCSRPSATSGPTGTTTDTSTNKLVRGATFSR